MRHFFATLFCFPFVVEGHRFTTFDAPFPIVCFPRCPASPACHPLHHFSFSYLTCCPTLRQFSLRHHALCSFNSQRCTQPRPYLSSCHGSAEIVESESDYSRPFPGVDRGRSTVGFFLSMFTLPRAFPPELTQCARLTSRLDAGLQATAFIIRATRLLCLCHPTLSCYLHRFGRQCSVGGTSSESPNRILSLATDLPHSLFYHGARPLTLPANSSFIT